MLLVHYFNIYNALGAICIYGDLLLFNQYVHPKNIQNSLANMMKKVYENTFDEEYITVVY